MTHSTGRSVDGRAAPRRAPAVLLALMTVVVITACSGGSGSSAPTTVPPPPISKATFLRKANAICAATEASLKKAEAAVSGSPDDGQVVGFVATKLIPATQAELAKIRALGTPTGDHGQLAGILAAMETTLNAVLADPGRAIAQTNPFAATDARLRAYGLPTCAT